MAEGPNDWEWQVGLATHEWKAAADPVLTGLGTGWSGGTPGQRSPRGRTIRGEASTRKLGCDGTIDFMFLTKLNPVEPPWYVTRMPGGVGGEAPRGVPLSQSMPLCRPLRWQHTDLIPNCPS